jgi:hypothetical protein
MQDKVWQNYRDRAEKAVGDAQAAAQGSQLAKEIEEAKRKYSKEL